MQFNKPQDKYIKLDHIRLHYLDWGNNDGPVLLMIHGIMGHARIWDDVSRRLCDRYHVLALDQRGHGESGRPEKAEYGMDDYLKDLSLFIDTLNHKKIILLGHSMGGRHAMFYAACNAERIDRLILVDVRPGNSPQASKALQELFLNLPLRVKSLGEVTEKMRELYPRLSPILSYSMARYGYTQNKEGHYIPKYDVRMGKLSEECDFQTEDLWPFLKNIACPTLIVRGENSPFLTRKEAQRMCRMIPNAIWKEINNASHIPAQENPEAFFHIISDFLRSHP